LAKSWVLLPFIAYACAIPALGPGALFLPIVILNAPLGIIGYFEKITLEPKDHQTTLILIIHAIFWSLWIAGFSKRKKLPVVWLGLIWCLLVAALFMSVSGCAKQLGPGLRDNGNWH